MKKWKQTPFKPAASAIAISIAAAFALSACGGDGSDPSRVSANPDTAPTNVTVGTSKVVKVTFTSTDGTSTNLKVDNLSSLPATWSADPAFTGCATVTSGTDCQLTLTYTPTATTPATDLTLNYSYTDDEGNKIGATKLISYSAVAPSGTAAFAYVTQLGATEGTGSVSKCNVATDGVLTCAAEADASTLALPAPEAIAINAAKTAMYVLTTPAAPATNSVYKCTVTDGTVSACAPEAGATELADVHDIAVSGNYLYTLKTAQIMKCSVGSAGALGECVEASAPASGLGFGESFVINGSNAWVADSSGNGSIKACAITAGTGDIAACTSAVDFPAQTSPLPPYAPIALAFDATGTNAYVILRDFNEGVGAIQHCTVAGSTMTCSDTPVALPPAVPFVQIDRIAVQGGFLYVTRGSEVFKAAIDTNGAIASSGFTAAVANAGFFTGAVTDIAF